MSVSTSFAGVGAITLFVEDLPSTKAFYEGAFGLTAVFEDDSSAAYGFGDTIINLLQVSAAHELIEPGVVADRAAGARFQLSVEVADVDTTCTELEAQGVSLLNGPMDRPWGLRTASFTDPAGHVWEIVHSLSGQSPRNE